MSYIQDGELVVESGDVISGTVLDGQYLIAFEASSSTTTVTGGNGSGHGHG